MHRCCSAYGRISIEYSNASAGISQVSAATAPATRPASVRAAAYTNAVLPALSASDSNLAPNSPSPATRIHAHSTV